MRLRMRRLPGALGGHYWTVTPYLAHTLRPAPPVRGSVWTAAVADERLGQVQITGDLMAPAGARGLLLVVHGMGGSIDSPYAAAAARAAAAAGLGCLRVNLRGADRSGEDFYHAALTADMHAALASPRLADFDAIYVLGFSLGGHMSLCLAAEPHDARVRAVAAVCAPLDLARGSADIDQAQRWPYRRYLLRGLKEIYRAVAQRREVPTPVEHVEGITTMRAWDQHTVVPRHGFRSVDDYYERASAARRLAHLRVPSLLVQAAHDPMVRAATVAPALAAPLSPLLDVRWVPQGGHVGFPRHLDLGMPAAPGLAPQVVRWLMRAGSRA